MYELGTIGPITLTTDRYVRPIYRKLLMKKIKGSPQYQMKVVPYRPYYHFFCALTSIILFILAVLASGYIGHHKGITTSNNLDTENQELQRLYTEKKNETEELLQKVANLELGSQVDRKAGEDIRAEMVTLKTRVAELEQDVAIVLQDNIAAAAAFFNGF